MPNPLQKILQNRLTESNSVRQEWTYFEAPKRSERAHAASEHEGKTPGTEFNSPSEGNGMANQKLLNILTQGVEVWNQWRQQKGDGAWTIPDLNAADLSGINLSGANLSYTKLQKANLKGTNFSHATFHYANLYAATLDNAILSKADLRHVTLYKASLIHANLKDADLRCANLRNANLTSANLSGADLQWADMRGVPWSLLVELNTQPEVNFTDVLWDQEIQQES